MWLQAEYPSIYQKAAHYLELKGYIFQRLFGTNKIDLSTATGTGVFNIFELQWDKEALEMTGIKESQLPNVVEPYEIEENLPHEYAKKWGFKVAPNLFGEQLMDLYQT